MPSNLTRTKIRKSQTKSGDEIVFWKSLQTCKLVDNMSVIDGHIDTVKNADILGHLKGMKAILEMLMSISLSTDGKLRRTSAITFDYGYQLYLCHANVSNQQLLMNDKNFKKSCKEFLCHERYGLCVYIFKDNIILKPDDVDLDEFFLAIFESEVEASKSTTRLDLHENLQRILDSMDSVWDKKVLKVVIGALHSRKQLEELGIRTRDIKEMTHSVLETLDEADRMESVADEMVIVNLNNKISNCKEKIKKLECKRKNMALEWTEVQLSELQQDIDDLKERKSDLETVQSGDNRQEKARLALMRKNTLKKLIRESRLKRRKVGSGRKLAMDEIDEQYLLKMIESKSTAHGRRGDEVMYTNQRVKFRDMKKIVNQHRLSRNLAPIKSNTTVYNRSRPHNKRSRQASLHTGLGLFCAKKAPKGEDNSNETTHYLRAFKNNVDRHHYETHKTDSAYVLEVSSDDKAYLQPGTSTGFRSARNLKNFQPTDENLSRKLPKYDFPQFMVNVVPGTHRYLSKDFEVIDGKSRKYFTSDSTYVFTRPKYFVGSTGAVWASEAMRLRWEVPYKYLVNEEDCADKSLLSVLVVLQDAAAYYIDSTHDGDLEKITDSKNCIHRRYEVGRVKTVSQALWQAFSLSTEITQDDDKERFNSNLKIDFENLSNLLAACKAILSADKSAVDVVGVIQQVKNKCSSLMEKIVTLLPTMKTRYLESTDGGPGVSVKQLDVKLSIMQRIRILNLDYYIRYHLANGDSSFNEVERCQSYIGDALCDGGTIEWEHQKLFNANTMDRLNKMTLDELANAKEKRMLYNARMVCKDVASRIDGAVSPNGYMRGFTTLSNEELFFNDKEFKDLYFSKGKNDKPLSPGGSYYSSLEKFYDDHCFTAEKYVEFLKGSCLKKNGEVCSYCTNHPWISPSISRVPAPYPDQSKLPEHHYCHVSDTPVSLSGVQREIDDFQPREQLKRCLEAKKISLDDPESIDSFCSKYITSRKLVVAALEHLQLLDMRKKKKKQQELQNKNKVVRYEDIDWEDYVEGNKLNKLCVKSLDLYFIKHGLEAQLKSRKGDKVKFIRNHAIFTAFKASLTNDHADGNVAEDGDAVDVDTDDDANVSSDESDHEVLAVINRFESDLEEVEDVANDVGDDIDMSDMDINDIFCTTRSRRTTKTWKACNFY